VAGQGTTDNLMDYTTGNKTILYKHQWDLVHDPETMLFAGREDAEEGKHMVVYLKDIPDNYRNPDKTITFFTPALLPITLPADVSSVIFSTSDEVSSESGGIKYLTPIGSLLKFSAGNEQYTFRGTDIHFFGYFNEKDSAYADRFTKKLTETGGYGLIAYPFYENGQTGYKLIKAALNPNSNEIKAAFALSSYQGQGIVNKNVASLLDQISSSGQAIVVPQGASIHAPILPPLSNTALEFLQRNSTLTKGDQWTAPLFIAHAHQISQRPIYENCLNDFWQNLDNDLKMLSDRKHSQDNVHVTSEQQFQKASDPSSFTGLFEDYNRWKKDIEKYRDYEKLVIAINKEIQEQNTPEKMLAWFRKNLTDAVDCLYDEIELSSRLKAIELLAQGSGSIFSDCPEYVNRLMETTVRNGQSNALYHAFRDKNNKLFLLLWNNTYLSDKARFVQNLSTIVTAYNPIDDIYCLPKTIVTTGKTEIANTTCFSFFYKQEALGLDQKASYSASIYQGKVILNGFFDNILFEKSEYDPFTMMKFTFPKGNCMSLGDDINPVTGAEFYAPAFYGAWLVNEVNKQKNREELAKGFRILLDGAVIVITGGSSATVRAALEVAFSGTDIIIQLNADDLKQTKEGVEYLNTWNELYITGGIGLGITYVPDLIEGAARSFSRIVVKEAGFVDSYRNMSPLLRDKFLNVFRLTGDILKKTKQLTASNIQTSNFIYKLAEINFSAKVSQIAKDVSTKVKNDLLTSIIYLNMEYDIAAFAFQGEQAYLKLAGSWGLKTGNVLMRMEEVAYTVPNSVRIEHGSIELVLNEGTKMFGWRVVPSNMALSRYANYTELTAWIKTGTLDTRLMDRLSTMSDDLLAGLEQSITFNRNLSSHFKTNPDHLDDWVMLFSKRYGGKAGNLRKSPMSVVLDPDALTALHSIRNTTQTVKQKLGITDDILAGMYTGKNDSYADLMSDMAALTKNLESNPTTGFANFNRVRDNLLLKGDADLITVNRRQGAHGVIKALNREVNLWKGGKIKFEEQVQNARNTLSSVDAQVEAIIEAESRTFRVEIKYCMDCVDASVIKIQLIERDMHVSRNIGEIKWWVIGQKITREDFAGWMVANREAINGLELSVKQRYFKNIRFESDIITDIDIRTFANQNFESIFN
jgi:hypothetical protein